MLLDKCLLDKVLGGEMHQPSYSFWCKAGDDMVTNILSDIQCTDIVTCPVKQKSIVQQSKSGRSGKNIHYPTTMNHTTSGRNSYLRNWSSSPANLISSACQDPGMSNRAEDELTVKGVTQGRTLYYERVYRTYLSLLTVVMRSCGFENSLNGPWRTWSFNSSY